MTMITELSITPGSVETSSQNSLQISLIILQIPSLNEEHTSLTHAHLNIWLELFFHSWEIIVWRAFNNLC